MVGDGSEGLPDSAPFDAIVVAAAHPRVPPPLAAQLAPGGRLVQPIGPGGLEDVTLFRRTAEGMLVRVCSLLPARFVPLYGRHASAAARSEPFSRASSPRPDNPAGNVPASASSRGPGTSAARSSSPAGALAVASNGGRIRSRQPEHDRRAPLAAEPGERLQEPRSSIAARVWLRIAAARESLRRPGARPRRA